MATVVVKIYVIVYYHNPSTSFQVFSNGEETGGKVLRTKLTTPVHLLIYKCLLPVFPW